jgi:hypothetical protein
LKKYLAVFFAAAIAVTTPVAANAEIVNIEVSDVDRNDRWLPSEFDIDYLSVADDTRYPDEIVFFVSVSGWMQRDSYVQRGEYLSVLIDSNNDGENDFYIRTPNVTYPINLNSVNIDLFSSDTNNPVQNCGVWTWMNMNNASNSNWIGFLVNRDCLSLSPTASITGSSFQSALYNETTDPFEFETGEEPVSDPNENGAPSTAIVAEERLNAGSFKGYVALYAKGYKGHKFSAKVGKDWVVRSSLEENFVRIVEYTGPGYTIDVRMYIDGVLTETVTVTTK